MLGILYCLGFDLIFVWIFINFGNELGKYNVLVVLFIALGTYELIDHIKKYISNRKK